MTPKEYLGQAYRLENRIHLQQRRVEELRELSYSISSPGFEEHYNSSKNTEAPFVRTIERIAELEAQENEKLNLLVDLRAQIRVGIDEMQSPDEALVLEHRYIYNMPWTDIGRELNVDERTVRRWHNKALAHYRVPENPIRI